MEPMNEAVPACKSLLEATANTRKLGGCESARIWRSDAPLTRIEADENRLRENGITTLIDLRTDAETGRKPCAYAEREGFRYYHIAITEGAIPPRCLEEVPVVYMKMAFQREMADVFRLIAAAEGGVMYFCAAGKDRTGVVSAVLQLTAGVDHGTIIRDYAASRDYNRVRLEAFLAEHPELDRKAVLANELSMERFIALFLGQFGDADAYFRSSGLTEAEIARLRAKVPGRA